MQEGRQQRHYQPSARHNVFSNKYGHITWSYIDMVPLRIFITDMYVEEEHRRKGHGSNLLRRFCHEWPPGTTIELDNVTNHDFFAKLGFQYVEDGDNTMRYTFPEEEALV